MNLPISEWKTFDTFFALDSFKEFWQESERLIQEAADGAEARSGPKWKPRTRDELGEFYMERDTARHLHDEIVLPTLRYSCVVMLFTILERELLRLVRNLERERKIRNEFKPEKGSLLKPIAELCKREFQLRFEDCRAYNGLNDLKTLRDCIIHCHGEVRLFDTKRKVGLMSITSRAPGVFAHDGLCIEIQSRCIGHFVENVRMFFLFVFNQLKWEIDDAFLKDP